MATENSEGFYESKNIMLTKYFLENRNQSIMVTTGKSTRRGPCIFIFGHFINVQFSKQPINNDFFPRLLRVIDFPT
jgi:hypothetical protein